MILLAWKQTWAAFLICGVAASWENPNVLSIDPSGHWDGSDGPWSTFELKLNTALGWKTVRLLPSFSVAAIFAVDSSACVNTLTKDCAERHGGLLQINASSDWANAGEYSLELGNDVGFGTVSGSFGFQSAALPTSKTGTVNGQAVALMDGSTFELGLMGLAPNNTAASTFSRQYSSITDSLSSISDDIHGSKMAARWGYTAGSFRRNFSASLTFGGYDLSRANFTVYVKNEISTNSSSLFQVVLEGITVRSNNYSNFGAGGSAESAVKATIEPALPYLWLPEYWCWVIANEFNLTWDSERELYSVPDDLDVESPDYKISFSMCGYEPCEDLTLPFSAFVLTAGLGSNMSTNASGLYFAMRPSESVILGRVFLQETYLFADYDQNFFRIGRAIFDKDFKPMFIDSEDRPAHPILDTGKIVGIVIAAVAVLAAVGYLVYAKLRRLWPFKKRQVSVNALDRKPELDGEGKPWAELSGKEQQELAGTGKPNEMASSAGEDAELVGSIPLYELPADEGQTAEERPTSARSR